MQNRLRHSGLAFGSALTVSGGGASWVGQAPTGLTVTVISSTRIDLSWTNVDTTGDGVSIERSADLINFSEITTVALGVATYSNTGLTQSTKYYYRVRAYKGTVYSSYSDYDFDTTWATAISDGNTVGWYDSSDTSTITKNASNLVSRWNDKLGSGRDLIQSGADSIKPLWYKNGVFFDGVNDFIKASFTLAQPEFIYIAATFEKFLANTYLVDGGAAGNTMIIRYTPAGTIPQLSAYAGAASGVNSTMKYNNLCIVRTLFNGASSKLQINEEVAVTGNFGTAAAGGITLGSHSGGATAFMRCIIHEVVLRKSADDSTTEGNIYNYFKSKYQGVWSKQGVVLEATEAAEDGNTYESSIIIDTNAQILTGTVFKMWYTAEWETPTINYAESVDGISWTKYASNPVLSNYNRGNVMKYQNLYYMAVTKTETQIDIYSSSDGITWTLVNDKALEKGTAGQWDQTYLGNSCLFVENGTWYLFYDGFGGSGWKTGLATSSDGINFTKYAGNPIIDAGTTMGGASILKSGSKYYLWLIGCCISGANLPSDIYRYSSDDLYVWTRDPSHPVLSRTTADEGVNTNIGQAADPFLLEYDNKVYMYYSGSADGSAKTGSQKIKLAIANMTLADLVKTNEGNIIA